MEKHHTLKSWCLELLKRNRELYFPEFTKAFDELSVVVENEMALSGKACFSAPMDQLMCNFLCRSIAGADPVASGLASLSTPAHEFYWQN